MKTLALFLLATAAHAAPARLSLDDYLGQVQADSPAVVAGRLHAEGGELRASAASTLTSPYLFGALNSNNDQSEPQFPLFQGTGLISNLYSVGVGANTPWGLDLKYTWNTAYANAIGVTLPSAGTYTSFNRLDATLHLVKNGFGSQISAQEELIRAGSQAQSLSGSYAVVSQLAAAEGAYWRLAQARQALQVQKDIIARAEKLLDWAKRRVNLQLGDRSDLLQAQAARDLHNVELATMLEEEKNSGRAFNLLRRQENDHVPEAVSLPSIEETLRMRAPEKEAERLDVQATAEKTKAAQAQSQIDKENLKPTVDVVGSYAWNGRENDRAGAISEATKDLHVSKAIAVNFMVPLNVPTWAGGVRGGNRDIEAANYELEQARLAEQKDWQDLTSRLEDARARLKLTSTLESVQRDKFENERQRLQRGRTTTFQTVTFEQDYAQSQLSRLRTQAEFLQIIAQMKSYRGKP